MSTKTAVVPALFLALLPKCPVCFAAYLAPLSGLGLQSLPLGPFLAATIALLLVAVAFTARAAWRRRRLGALALALGGAAIVLLGRWLEAPAPVLLSGVALLGAGSLGARR